MDRWVDHKVEEAAVRFQDAPLHTQNNVILPIRCYVLAAQVALSISPM